MSIAQFGYELTTWSVRASLVCCVVAFAVPLGTDGERSARLARRVWTLAWLLYLGHLAAAFQFWHGWSHARAYAHTARRTAEAAGVEWGGGIYFNYLFTLAWTCDVALWWARPPDGAARWRWIWLAFFWFMTLQASIVFASGPTRWVALAVVIPLTGVWLRQVARARANN
jgi:hypothetical protein